MRSLFVCLYDRGGDTMVSITTEKAVVILYDKPKPIAFLNVYDEGDVWIKTKGCEDCPEDSRAYCCGNCKMFLKDNGECRLHIDDDGRQKPFRCVIDPSPEICHAWCSLEFECIVGPKKGKIRKVKDIRDVFS
jgi:hypothetical protein